MKKIRTLIASLIAVLAGVVALSSCNEGEYNFYQDWSQAGSSIAEDNIFTVISVDKAKEMIDAKKTFILVVSTSKVSACRYELPYLDETAKALGFEGTVYFINAQDFIEKGTTRNETEKKLGIKFINCANHPDYPNRELCVVVYNKGEVFLDTSNLNDNVVNDFYKLDSFTQSPYEALSAYLFKDCSLKFE